MPLAHYTRGARARRREASFTDRIEREILIRAPRSRVWRDHIAGQWDEALERLKESLEG
jgi:hypothetical protein